MSDSSSEFSDRCILYSLTGLESHWSNPLSSENHKKQGSLSESEFCAVIFYFNYTCRVKKNYNKKSWNKRRSFCTHSQFQLYNISTNTLNKHQEGLLSNQNSIRKVMSTRLVHLHTQSIDRQEGRKALDWHCNTKTQVNMAMHKTAERSLSVWTNGTGVCVCVWAQTLVSRGRLIDNRL